MDRREWAEWLSEWMRLYEAELSYEARHAEDLSLDALIDAEPL